MFRVALVLCALAAACAALAGSARADGDPASDVLYSEWVFLPSDAQGSDAERARLDRLVSAARAAGLPVKVAVIGSSYDLGSVTALWRRPRLYARFLGTELRFVYKGRLLVAMPNGLGVALNGSSSPADEARLRGLEPGGSLVATAAAAVRALAKGHGIALTASGDVELPAAAEPAPSRWPLALALAAGLAAIAAAWGFSLRARPLAHGSRSGGG